MTWRPSARQWRIVRRVLFTAFFLAVAILLFRHAREVEWSKVAGAMASYTPRVLALAVAMALASHLLYGSFDLLARAHVRHGLAAGATLAIATVSYAFNVNLGALVGGVGFRYRLYSRYGLRASEVARVYAFCVTTNWSGYVLLMGALLASDLVAVPESWGPGGLASRALGALLLLVIAGYLVLCILRPHHRLSFRGRGVRVPGLRFAAAQLLLSSLHWTLMGGILHLLLDRQLAYTDVLGTLLLAAIAGAATHIPAGLGVLEGVFVLVLSDRVPSHELIAALLVYRAVYYLVPLLAGLIGFAALEWKASR